MFRSGRLKKHRTSKHTTALAAPWVQSLEPRMLLAAAPVGSTPLTAYVTAIQNIGFQDTLSSNVSAGQSTWFRLDVDVSKRSSDPTRPVKLDLALDTVGNATSTVFFYNDKN